MLLCWELVRWLPHPACEHFCRKGGRWGDAWSKTDTSVSVSVQKLQYPARRAPLFTLFTRLARLALTILCFLFDRLSLTQQQHLDLAPSGPASTPRIYTPSLHTAPWNFWGRIGGCRLTLQLADLDADKDGDHAGPTARKER